MKELPKMYQNKINKTINSSRKVYSTIDNNNTTINSDIRYPSISIDKKIDNIFKSHDYVYKVDVTIITDNETLKKRIVARNNNNLITINNEYIPISIIRDIYK
jgi:hypothetical protein